jgi:hypothetical protein
MLHKKDGNIGVMPGSVLKHSGVVIKMPFRFLGVAICLLIAGGCTSSRYLVVPTGTEISSGLVNRFKGGQPLALVNSQLDNNPVKIGSGGDIDFYGVMHTWTQAVVDQLQKELAKRKIRVVPKAEHKLQLRVVDARIFFGSRVGSGTAYSSLKLEVTFDDRMAVFEGNHSAVSLGLSAGGAVSDAVAALLRDTAIVEFITRSSVSIRNRDPGDRNPDLYLP